MKVRKKPVVVEAWLWDGDTPHDERPLWTQNRCYLTYDRFLVIPTLEGEMLASPGDYIILGVENEVYPIKPGIMWKTYEMVEE